MGEVKQINIIFKTTINLKDFGSNLVKIDKKHDKEIYE